MLLVKTVSRSFAFRSARSQHYTAVLVSRVPFALPGSAISFSRPINAFPRFISSEFDRWPGILVSMNSLRNSWSAASAVNNLSSSTVSLSVMNVPCPINSVSPLLRCGSIASQSVGDSVAVV